MKTSHFCCALAIAATAVGPAAANPTPPARGAVSAAIHMHQQQVSGRPVVPLRVQRLLERRAPRAAYLPTRLPTGYSYFGHENLGSTGFDLYFSCCVDFHPPIIGFHAVLLKRSEVSEGCNRSAGAKLFRIGGVVVAWSLAGDHDQEAWRCIRRGGTTLRLAASGERSNSQDTSWCTPRQLARMVASARPIR